MITCTTCGNPWTAGHLCPAATRTEPTILRRRTTDEIVAILVARMGTAEVRIDALERATPVREDVELDHGITREMLHHDLQRAERERDEVRSDRDLWKSTSEAMSRERSASDEAAIAARASVEKLRAALVVHGGHKPYCNRVSLPQMPCTCGLQAALDQAGDA